MTAIFFEYLPTPGPKRDGRGLAHCFVGGQGSGEHLGAALVSVASAGPWR